MSKINSVVIFNVPVKIRFDDGQEMIIKILEQKPLIITGSTPEFPVSRDSPIAQAVLGHSVGETIPFEVKKSKRKVTLVSIIY